jgi:ABC-2 type transport system ATP-binding protein
MDEAQHLADRVAILRSGEIVAQGKPDELGAHLGRTIISYRSDGEEKTIETDDAQAELYKLLQWAEKSGVKLEGLEVRRPSLEDVFLKVTGGEESDS